MLSKSETSPVQPSRPEWYEATARYARPSLAKAVWQLVNTFVPYTALWVLMAYTVRQGYNYGITVGLAAAASVFYVRIFIFFHDCCHGSFFASFRANRILGYVTGILTFTPFDSWRRTHAVHHTTVADLDRRGVGDVWTMTVEEYLASPWRKRLAYRIYRNPLVLLGLGPIALFLILYRYPNRDAKKNERSSVLVTDLAILAILGTAILMGGLRTYLQIQIPVILIGGAIGTWLFYIQHQFEGVYWARHEDWDPLRAALEGSSYYRLPRVLQWCTGNIGLHHIHHIRPLIPNYNLQQCINDVPALQSVSPLSIRRSLNSLRFNLYDEQQKALVSFGSLKTLQA